MDRGPSKRGEEKGGGVVEKKIKKTHRIRGATR